MLGCYRSYAETINVSLYWILKCLFLRNISSKGKGKENFETNSRILFTYNNSFQFATQVEKCKSKRVRVVKVKERFTKEISHSDFRYWSISASFTKQPRTESGKTLAKTWAD